MADIRWQQQHANFIKADQQYYICNSKEKKQ